MIFRHQRYQSANQSSESMEEMKTKKMPEEDRVRETAKSLGLRVKKIHRRISWEEFDERWFKGLCMFCDELETPDHHLRHKGSGILMIEGDEDQLPHDEDLIEMEDTSMVDVEEKESLSESVPASQLQDIKVTQQQELLQGAETIMDIDSEVPVSNLELSLRFHNAAPVVCEDSQSVVSFDDLFDHEEAVFVSYVKAKDESTSVTTNHIARQLFGKRFQAKEKLKLKKKIKGLKSWMFKYKQEDKRLWMIHSQMLSFPNWCDHRIDRRGTTRTVNMNNQLQGREYTAVIKESDIAEINGKQDYNCPSSFQENTAVHVKAKPEFELENVVYSSVPDVRKEYSLMAPQTSFPGKYMDSKSFFKRFDSGDCVVENGKEHFVFMIQMGAVEETQTKEIVRKINTLFTKSLRNDCKNDRAEYDRDRFYHLMNLSSLQVLRIFVSTQLEDRSRELAIRRLIVLLSDRTKKKVNIQISEFRKPQPLLISCLKEEGISESMFKILGELVNHVSREIFVNQDEKWDGLVDYITSQSKTEFQKAVFILQCLTMALHDDDFVIPVMENLLPEIRVRLKPSRELFVDYSSWFLAFKGAFCASIHWVEIPSHAESAKDIADKMIDSVRDLVERRMEVGLVRRAFRDVENIVKKQIKWFPHFET